ALAHNTTGNYNIAVGASAGSNITTGSSNIEIGNAGAAGDTSTIRIGTSQTATYIAGISGRAVTGADVVVDGMGKLGVVASSARYKRDIRDMGTTSNALMKLRPVTFRYKSDERGATQYGLIAEEVQRVYPELVMFDADGKVETVRYSMLISMLLNELQKQSQENARQAAQLQRQETQLTNLMAKQASNQQAEQIQRMSEQQMKLIERLANVEQTIKMRNESPTLASMFSK